MAYKNCPGWLYFFMFNFFYKDCMYCMMFMGAGYKTMYVACRHSKVFWCVLGFMLKIVQNLNLHCTFLSLSARWRCIQRS